MWVQLLVRYYSVVYTNNVTFKASILYCVIKKIHLPRLYVLWGCIIWPHTAENVAKMKKWEALQRRLNRRLPALSTLIESREFCRSL